MQGEAVGSQRPVLSVVVPVFNESASIPPLYEEISRVIRSLGVTAEVVFVDDGSSDDSWQQISNLSGPVRRVRFSRNFGKEAALSAGIDVATGDAIVVIDADLQHPPAVIIELFEQWKSGSKIVCASRENRDEDGRIRGFMSNAFYRTFNSLSDHPIPQGVSDFRLMDRHVADVVRLMPERSRFMKAMLTWPGFDLAIVPFQVAPRTAGKSTFSPLRLWRFGLDGLFNFSSRPLQVWMYLGLATIGLSLIVVAWMFIDYLILGASLSGYRTVIAIVIGLAGVQILGIGVLGEYLARLFIETKGRPLYVVSESNTVPTTNMLTDPRRSELLTYPRPQTDPAD
jgi:glycosyltransferase involved in cell wall biosynthesis